MTADDDARWAEARSLADGRATVAAERRLRRSRRRRLGLAAGVVVLVLGLCTVLGLVLRDSAVLDGVADVPVWQEVVGLVMNGAGVVVVVVAVVRQVRRFRRSVTGLSSPHAVLTARQRRALAAQVRGREPVDPAQLPLTLDLAQRMAAQEATVLLPLGLTLSVLGQAIAAPAWWRVPVVLGTGLCFVVGAVLVRRDVRHAERFLAEHPAPGV